MRRQQKGILKLPRADEEPPEQPEPVDGFRRSESVGEMPVARPTMDDPEESEPRKDTLRIISEPAYDNTQVMILHRDEMQRTLIRVLLANDDPELDRFDSDLKAKTTVSVYRINERLYAN